MTTPDASILSLATLPSAGWFEAEFGPVFERARAGVEALPAFPVTPEEVRMRYDRVEYLDGVEDLDAALTIGALLADETRAAHDGAWLYRQTPKSLGYAMVSRLLELRSIYGGPSVRADAWPMALRRAVGRLVGDTAVGRQASSHYDQRLSWADAEAMWTAAVEAAAANRPLSPGVDPDMV